MNQSHIKSFCLLFVLIVSIIACQDDDTPIINENELITSLIYTLTPTTGGDAVTFSFIDLDGGGGNQPVITQGKLTNNQSYTGSIRLLNESVTPTENITDEVNDEKEEHQFFYQINDANLNINYNDTDSNGFPVGLSTLIETGSASTGTLTITLKHEPEKSAEGVNLGNITNAGGETDIEVVFQIDIE